MTNFKKTKIHVPDPKEVDELEFHISYIKDLEVALIRPVLIIGCCLVSFRFSYNVVWVKFSDLCINTSIDSYSFDGDFDKKGYFVSRIDFSEREERTICRIKLIDKEGCKVDYILDVPYLKHEIVLCTPSKNEVETQEVIQWKTNPVTN